MASMENEIRVRAGSIAQVERGAAPPCDASANAVSKPPANAARRGSLPDRRNEADMRSRPLRMMRNCALYLRRAPAPTRESPSASTAQLIRLRGIAQRPRRRPRRSARPAAPPIASLGPRLTRMPRRPHSGFRLGVGHDVEKRRIGRRVKVAELFRSIAAKVKKMRAWTRRPSIESRLMRSATACRRSSRGPSICEPSRGTDSASGPNNAFADRCARPRTT
jgi:hypothetical protein